MYRLHCSNLMIAHKIYNHVVVQQKMKGYDTSETSVQFGVILLYYIIIIPVDIKINFMFLLHQTTSIAYADYFNKLTYAPQSAIRIKIQTVNWGGSKVDNSLQFPAFSFSELSNGKDISSLDLLTSPLWRIGKALRELHCEWDRQTGCSIPVNP